ncbi:MAG: hypothetical protein F4Y86_14660 [Gammaproteobacteria bacterium]|nr:hypothetical protein [Gammaproteobacteria bacterium]MXY53749.1 hypothetical protein [Gammaproteobacteria bacterium]
MTSIVEALDQYGNRPYLLTVGEDGPHTSHTRVALAGGGLTCPLSKSAAGNVRARPAVSFLWPAIEPGGYAIIMNGTVRHVDDGGDEPVASIDLSKAVFHRPGAPQPGHGGSCTSDCLPIQLYEVV